VLTTLDEKNYTCNLSAVGWSSDIWNPSRSLRRKRSDVAESEPVPFRALVACGDSQGPSGDLVPGGDFGVAHRGAGRLGVADLARAPTGPESGATPAPAERGQGLSVSLCRPNVSRSPGPTQSILGRRPNPSAGGLSKGGSVADGDNDAGHHPPPQSGGRSWRPAQRAVRIGAKTLWQTKGLAPNGDNDAGPKPFGRRPKGWVSVTFVPR